jgi:prepilin-type N-terminal cleavage/methylation domain-containing protein
MKRDLFLKKRVSGHRAFTLLEVVVAMLLLAIGLLALVALQIRAIRSNSFSNGLTVASCFARNQVETLRAASAADWNSVTDGTFSEILRDTNPNTGATRRVFTRRLLIQTEPSGRMRTVSVTVSWNQDGRSHQTTIDTLIANRQ